MNFTRREAITLIKMDCEKQKKIVPQQLDQMTNERLFEWAERIIAVEEDLTAIKQYTNAVKRIIGA